jgi:hypothetical protein
MSLISRSSKKLPGKIPAPPDLRTVGLNFSFKHLDLDGNRAFSLDLCEDGYLRTLLERLRDISGKKIEEFRRERSLGVHQIEWSRTSQPRGFAHLNQQLKGIPALEFRLSVNKHGRIHGFFIDETFFIVWLDPDHKLFPGKRR